jgi:hypothetical protein
MGEHAVLMCRLNSSAVILLFVIVNVTDNDDGISSSHSSDSGSSSSKSVGHNLKFHTTATFVIVDLWHKKNTSYRASHA